MTTWLATHRGLRALSSRETARVLKLWTQTILAPILSSALFILVFGLSLGDRIREIDGFPYDQYIVPGLIAMSMAQAAYANNSSSVFQARFDRYINDVLASPMRGWEVNLGLNLAARSARSLIGAGLLAIALPLTGVPVREPLVLVAALLAAADDLLLVRRRRRHLRGVLGPVGVRDEPRDPAGLVPRRRLLLRRPPAVAVAGDLPRQPALLPDRRRAPRLPGHERRAGRDLARRRRRAGGGVRRVEQLAVRDRAGG